uniref:Odorant binding protein 6 n=1 Tax=Athetis dissimilis TaxID=1737331 RepID=A0A0X9KLL4_ATHDI|nr:odorant binding protein 6 [Athetis dissimilis]
MFHLYISVFIYCVFSMSVKASSLDELKTKYVELILECSNSYPITGDDMSELRQKTMPDSEPVKCLFACVYKKAGMMNEHGQLSVQGVNEMTRKYLADDPEKIKKSEEFTQACESVNDVEVSDGERGCDRAALIFKCTVEKSPDFDLL